MSGKFALIIGNTEYTDPGLAQLTAPSKDAEDFARVLKDQDIGAFDSVNILLNQPSATVNEVIDEFFDHKKPDDLLVLYFSGHGVRDELGALYLAVKNTIRSRLRSTAIKSDYIREVMDQSRSKRQVLILDCCNSGAFSQGTKAATGVSIGTSSAFESGFGRIILTASDSTQFAWEGDKVIGETDNSLFTHYLVEGLEGEADLDGDGRITVDELYDYAYEKVKHATPKQTPSKFSSKQQGEIVLRQSMRIEDMKPVPLPTPLLDSIENPFSDVRMGAVQQLIKLLNGKNLGLARSAQEALERIAEEDDSRQVINAARQALESGQTPRKRVENYISEIKAPDSLRITYEHLMEAERSEIERAERFAAPTIDAKEFPKPETEKLTMPIANRQAMITLGWAIAGIIGGAIYKITGEEINGGVVGGAVGGAIGGFVTAIALYLESYRSNGRKILLLTLASAIGLSAGWFIGELIRETIGSAIGYAIGGTIIITILLSTGYVFPNWKNMVRIVLAWTIGGAIGWSAATKFLVNYLPDDSGIHWAIGIALGWTIGGYVLGWQLLKSISGRTNESYEKVTYSSKPSQIKLTETQKVFLLSPLGRSLLGVIVGLILGIFYGINYGRINGLTYDFAYAYSSLVAPHGILLITCALAGLTIYPHKVSIGLLIIGFFVAGISESYPYKFIALGGIFGLPAGALISRILYWLKIIE